MREIKFRYTIVRENGHIFHRDFTLLDIEAGYAINFLAINGFLTIFTGDNLQEIRIRTIKKFTKVIF